MTRLRAGLGRKCMRALTFVSTLALVAGTANAQVDEPDRLARCENNRQAIANVEGQLRDRGYWSEETIARAQATAQALVGRMESFLTLYNEFRYLPSASLLSAQQYHQAIAEARPLVEITTPFGISCEETDLYCVSNLLVTLVARIDQQVAAQPGRVMAAQAIANYRTNLIALRCDQAANTTFTLAGTWNGSNRLTYELSQTGPVIGWRVNSISETGTGSVDGMSVTASWRGNWGEGSSRGTVSLGPDGSPNRITWNNGIVFTR